MDNYKNEIELMTFLIACETNNFTHWNNRGFYKMHKAMAENNIGLLKESIFDLKIAIKICKNYHPENTFYLAEANTEMAKKQLDILNIISLK